MHYKNGREAKNGDKVVFFPSWGSPVVGILYGNCHIAPSSPTDPCPDLKEVLHLDDVLQALKVNGVPDSSVPTDPPSIATPQADGDSSNT